VIVFGSCCRSPSHLFGFARDVSPCSLRNLEARLQAKNGSPSDRHHPKTISRSQNCSRCPFSQGSSPLRK
jgi:hypothetical protein